MRTTGAAPSKPTAAGRRRGAGRGALGHWQLEIARAWRSAAPRCVTHARARTPPAPHSLTPLLTGRCASGKGFESRPPARHTLSGWPHLLWQQQPARRTATRARRSCRLCCTVRCSGVAEPSGGAGSAACRSHSLTSPPPALSPRPPPPAAAPPGPACATRSLAAARCNCHEGQGANARVGIIARRIGRAGRRERGWALRTSPLALKQVLSHH